MQNKATQTYLAMDLGAESGRGVLADWDGARLSLREVRRFPTGRGDEDLGADSVRRWDWARLWTEVQTTLAQVERDVGTLSGVGVDSWGVDFGLLDAQGTLLEPPVHYRDLSHPRAMERALSIVPAADIWAETGIQFMPFNTLYQLCARQERDPALLDKAAHLLLVPDLLHNQLTGGTFLGSERTNASTTQCLNPITGAWNRDLLARLGLPSHFLGTIAEAGTRVGQTANGIPVYAPGTHDTASAVAAVPAEDGVRAAFLSSGTWSVLGVETSAPNLSPEAWALGLSNEGGVGGRTRLLKNIMGLWLVQECRRSLQKREDRSYEYAELAALAAAAPSGPTVDATDARFLAPADMREEIAAACLETGQTVPGDVGALIRCCLDSLALAYRNTLRDLEGLLGQGFDALHVVGGGAQNRLLNQLTADACGLPVVAGPSEATALGNALGQLVAAGEVKDWTEARAVARLSSATATFLPSRPQ